MKNYLIYSFLAGAFSPASALLAHGTELLPDKGFSGNYGLTGLYQSKAIIAEEERWLVPGFLLGGEAFPHTRQVSVADAAFQVAYRRKRTYVTTKIESHGGHVEPKIGEAYVGYVLIDDMVAVEFGRMDSRISRDNGQHLFQLDGTQTLLGHQVLWGGMFNNDAIRLRYLLGNSYELGFELLSGRSFPLAASTTSSPGYMLYQRFNYRGDQWNFGFQLSGFHGYASQREDDRFDAGHVHGVDEEDIPFFAYDGSVIGAVGGFSISYGTTEQIAMGLQVEFMWQNGEGDLRDETRRSAYGFTYNSWRTDLFTEFSDHRIRLRSELLRHENKLHGAAGEALAEKTGLQHKRDPLRLSLGYRYLLHNEANLRFELIRDESTINDIDIVAFSFNWFGDLASF